MARKIWIPRSTLVGEFEVVTDRGFWVAIWGERPNDTLVQGERCPLYGALHALGCLKLLLSYLLQQLDCRFDFASGYR